MNIRQFKNSYITHISGTNKRQYKDSQIVSHILNNTRKVIYQAIQKSSYFKKYKKGHMTGNTRTVIQCLLPA